MHHKVLVFIFACISFHLYSQNPAMRLLGEWIGEGVSDGILIADSVSFSTVDFSSKHIRFQLNEIGGNLAMEGFLYQGEDNQFSLFEFNNGRWPNREFHGFFENDRFSLMENTDDRKILLEIIILDEQSFRLRESLFKVEPSGDEFVIVVDEIFKKLTP